MRIGVVDYKAGNLKSVETALHYLGADFIIGDKPELFRGLDKLIFPGVGEAKAAMDVLKESGLGEAIKEFYKSGNPLLGICIGSQIVLDRSEERDTECLGIVRGKARRFSRREGLKIPQIGWNEVKQQQTHPLFKGIPDEVSFYFVHSYYPDPSEDGRIISTTTYGESFCSAFCQENLVAVQFHPEKSGPFGLDLLENFVRDSS